MLVFANSAGLDILETTLINIQDMPLGTVLGDEGQKALYLELPKIMNQVIYNKHSSTQCIYNIR